MKPSELNFDFLDFINSPEQQRKSRESADAYIMQKYGMTMDQYAAERKALGNPCPHCGIPTVWKDAGIRRALDFINWMDKEVRKSQDDFVHIHRNKLEELVADIERLNRSEEC